VGGDFCQDRVDSLLFLSGALRSHPRFLDRAVADFFAAADGSGLFVSGAVVGFVGVFSGPMAMS